MQAPTVEALRAQLHVLYPDAITHVDATDATPWSRVVVALAAGCPSSHLTRTAELPTGATTAIEGEAPAGGAPRSKEQIQRVIRGHLPALRACYERALLKDPDAGGRVILGLTVTPRGDVREAAIGDSEEVDAEMGACLRKEAGTMKFPASSDETTIRYPLIFESSG